MNDTASRRHPLDIAWPDDPAIPGGIPVCNLSVIDDGHGFKSAMRVLPDTTRLISGIELMGARIIEQQERADRCAIMMVRKQRPDGEPVTDPMTAMSTQDFCNLLHVCSLLDTG